MRTVSSSERVRALIDQHGALAAVLTVSAATLAFLPLRPYLGSEQWGWPYLLVVGLVAGTAGVGPALIAAVLSFLSWNFLFIEPYYTFHVAKTGDLIHLLAFLVVAVTVGLQTGRLRESKQAAGRQETRTAALYRLSSGMVLDISPAHMAEFVDTELARVLGCRGACVWIPSEHGGSELSRLPEGATCGASASAVEAAKRALASEETAGGRSLASGDSLFMRLETNAGSEGVLQICGLVWLDEEDRLFAASVAHLVAAYLEGRHMGQLAMRASAAEEAERLRTALVSSVSHELKTPVASLTASVTDLLGRESAPSAEQLRESLSTMAEDLFRLDRSIGNLLDVSRLEAQAWLPQPERFEVGELVGSVVSDLTKPVRQRIEYEIPRGIPLIHADFVQTSRALRHVVDNALQYSTDTVTIGGEAPGPGVVSLWVTDTGPGIPIQERKAVFEKFYRGASGRRSRSSTGLGLSLAREILVANGGEIRIEATRPTGTTVVLTLPADQELPAA